MTTDESKQFFWDQIASSGGVYPGATAPVSNSYKLSSDYVNGTDEYRANLDKLQQQFSAPTFEYDRWGDREGISMSPYYSFGSPEYQQFQQESAERAAMLGLLAQIGTTPAAPEAQAQPTYQPKPMPYDWLALYNADKARMGVVPYTPSVQPASMRQTFGIW
jgi:hypothetical protein